MSLTVRGRWSFAALRNILIMKHYKQTKGWKKTRCSFIGDWARIPVFPFLLYKCAFFQEAFFQPKTGPDVSAAALLRRWLVQIRARLLLIEEKIVINSWNMYGTLLWELYFILKALIPECSAGGWSTRVYSAFMPVNRLGFQTYIHGLSCFQKGSTVFKIVNA